MAGPTGQDGRECDEFTATGPETMTDRGTSDDGGDGTATNPCRNLPYWAQFGLVAASYTGAAALGVRLGTVVGTVPLAWPAAGLALAATLLCGVRIWPALALGAAAASWFFGSPALSVAAEAVAATTEAVVAATLLRRLTGFQCSFDRIADVAGLILVAGVLTSLLGGAISVAGACATGLIPWDAFWSATSIAWLSHAVGILFVAPVILTWAARPRLGLRGLRLAEAVLLVALVVGSSGAVFLGHLTPETAVAVLSYGVLPPLLWAALRFEVRAASTLALVAVCIAAPATAQGLGPFHVSYPAEDFIQLWGFLCSAAVVTMLLSAAARERRRSETAYRELLDRIRGGPRSDVTDRLLETPGAAAPSTPPLLPPLMVVLLSVAAVIVAFEVVKEMLAPDLVGGAANIATVIFGALVATVASFVVLRRQRALYAEILEGVVERRRLENAQSTLREHTMHLETMTTELEAQVAERKQAEAALRRSEAGFRSMFERHDAVMLLIDPQTADIVDANEAAGAFYGYSRECLRTMKAPELNDLSPQEMQQNIQRALEGVENRFVGKHRLASGEVREVDVHASPIDRLDRQFLFCIINDVTERRKAEEALKAGEARFRRLVETMNDGLGVVDEGGTFTYVNDRLAKLLGHSRKALLGTVITRYLDPRNRQILETQRESRKLGEAGSYELQWTRGDGAELATLVSAQPVTGADGEYRGSFAIITDISEVKRLESSLLQAQKMEAVGRLAGGVAHDFNNLLTAIIGFAELAQMKLASDDPLLMNMAQILEAGNSAKDLTQQLLAFSRKQVLELQVVNLNHVAESMAKMLGPIIGEDVALSLHLSPSLGHVRADVTQMEQVLMNLVVNARDAMPDGGRLVLRTYDEIVVPGSSGRDDSVEAGAYVVLSVSDTGIGMDAATRAQIFEPFFTTKEHGVGTGLGLSTSYGIVKQQQGHILVVTAPGEGSTFRVYLPRVAGVETVESVPEERPLVRGGETVLVVEDEDVVRVLVHDVLTEHGYTVLTANDAEEALVIAEKHREEIQLLLTDVVMPGLSGKDLYDRLAGMLPKMNVLFMSGYADDQIARHGVLEPGVSFIPKPFSVHELAKKVRETLDG